MTLVGELWTTVNIKVQILQLDFAIQNRNSSSIKTANNSCVYLHHMIISTEEILKYFPSFEKGLAEGITRHEEIRTFRENEFLMQTGQYIRSTMLVLEGLIIYQLRMLLFLFLLQVSIPNKMYKGQNLLMRLK